MSVKVSVCIPVYGVEKYIEKCARSLFEQTMRDGLEFVFVNDCTPDKSIEILEQLLSEYPHRKEQTKIINLPENGGVGRARRIAIENCTGEYIIHCDPDDWVGLDMYEKMYNAAKENDADMVYCDFIKEESNGSSTRSNTGSTQSAIEIQKDMIGALTRGYLWNRMYRSEIAQRDYSEVCPKDINYTEDLMRNIFSLNYTDKIIKVSEALYHYRENPASISFQKANFLAKNLWDGFLIIEKHFKDDKYKDAVNGRRRYILRALSLSDLFPAATMQKLFRHSMKGLWHDKFLSAFGKFYFLLAYIHFPMANYIFQKMKGVK